ncbi:MAG TPA: DUF177 domain-containing protein [Acidimicrobiales bacterium]|jgi:uncharacterized protein|nr:DUF177 domain-containing protein [Acidimicrobiales bacterium]
MSNPWLVPITTLRRSVGTRRQEQRAGRVGELQVADSRVAGEAEVEADVVLDSVDGGIEVAAVITAPWTGECRRCLRVIAGTLEAEVRELYRPRPPGEPVDQDEDTYPLTGELLDLQPLIRDAILLELPLNPLCREDCAGLCPTCGADLADGPCDCAAPPADPRWAALDVLRPAAPGDLV